MPTSAIFVTNDDLTSRIGTAQVLPYLEGLSRRGHSLRCISIDESRSLDAGEVSQRIGRAGIRHAALPKAAGGLYKLQRFRSGQRLGRSLEAALRGEAARLVHCRSYAPIPASLRARAAFGTRFLFDMRGFWVDQRTESGLWPQSSLFWRGVAGHFRRLEGLAIERSDAIVVLTGDARAVVESHPRYRGAPIEVIPCSVDLDRFRFDPAQRARRLAELGYAEGDLVLAVLGGNSALYGTEAAYRLLAALKARGLPARLLFLGHDDPAPHLARARDLGLGLDARDLACRTVPHAEVPSYLSAADLGLSFIMPSRSSLGVSATKVGEYLACGLPVASNRGVGDIDAILPDPAVGHVLPDFSDAAVARCADWAASAAGAPRGPARARAEAHFDLADAVARYDRLYERLGA